MAIVKRIRRISNPRHHKRRKMPAKQIRIFGTKRQKAALRAKNHRPKHRPRAKVSRRRPNPALVVTLGSMNPKRSKNVPAAKTNRRRRRANVRHHRRRRSNPVVRRNRRHRNRTAPVRMNRRRRRATNIRHHRRRRNGPRIVVMRPNRKRYNRRRRNPDFGQGVFGGPLFGRNAMELMGGGLLGLVAAKFIPTLFPASLTGTISGSNIGRVVISGISAVIAGWAGSKISVPLGQGMLFGGMIQTVSVALNAFLPSVYSQLNPSLGDLIAGQFPVPQNPIRAGQPAPLALPAPAAGMPAGGQVRLGRMSAVDRVYGTAY